MINNEDKKYYGTDYSTQAILMEEEIYSYITEENREKLTEMREMRDLAEQVKSDRSNMDLQRKLLSSQERLNKFEERDEIIHNVLDMVKQLKSGQLPPQVPPKVLYDKIMDNVLMQNIAISILVGQVARDMFDDDLGPVADAMKKYVEDNFVGSSEDVQELHDDYGIDFDKMLDGRHSGNFHEFVTGEVLENFSPEQKMAWIREMRDDGLIPNRDYLRMYIANEAHKRQQLAAEMSKQQPNLEQTDENSFGGMRSSR